MRILIVDSDGKNLILMRDMLAADHDVYVVRTLAEIEDDRQFDLVLADNFNPLCPFESVETYCKEKDLTIVAVSAMPNKIHQRQLNKPFDRGDLDRVVTLVESGVKSFVVDSIETRYLRG